jgi:ribosomal protein L31
MSKIPDGFKELVERILKEDPFEKRVLPNNTKEIWNNFTWHIFLTEDRNIAQVSFIHNSLLPTGILDLELVYEMERKDWIEKFKKEVEKTIKNLSGIKYNIMKTTISDEQLEEMSTSIKDLSIFFKNNNVNKKFLLEKTKNDVAIGNFIVEMASAKHPNHIRYIGFTKSVLWLNHFGLALNFCPNSRQVKNFIEEDMGETIETKSYYKGSRIKVEADADEYTFFVFQGKIRKFKEDLQIFMKSHITVRDVQLAIWYYKTAQSLLSNTHFRKKLTPKMLLDYFDARKMTLDDFDDKINNIDEIDDLREDLKHFVQ